jgi:hypothetical protein
MRPARFELATSASAGHADAHGVGRRPTRVWLVKTLPPATRETMALAVGDASDDDARSDLTTST